jgi:SAM-dependent methyltransferase
VADHEFSRLLSVRRIEISQCQRCGLVVTPHLYHGTTGGEYRKENDIRFAEYTRYTLPSRLVTWSRYLPRLEVMTTGRSLLDVGAGYGFFVREAGSRGWQAIGVEPGNYRFLPEVQASMVRGTMGDLLRQGRRFDVITAWDVIEHVHDAQAFINEARELLVSGGVLCLRTPDARALLLAAADGWGLARAYVELIYPTNPLEHIVHFTPEYLTRIIGDHCFTEVEVSYDDSPEEFVLLGRTPLVSLVKRTLAFGLRNRRLPFEFTVLAKADV